MIKIGDFTFYYTDTEKPALQNINLEVQDGEFVLCRKFPAEFFSGTSGSGVMIWGTSGQPAPGVTPVAPRAPSITPECGADSMIVPVFTICFLLPALH